MKKLSKRNFEIFSIRFKGQDLLVFVFLVIGYFLSRLINLTSLPVFADEAIYIRWSQVMTTEPTLRFLPLSDGKQPLFMWLTIPFLKVFADPLFAGRFVSVLSGFLTMFGLGGLVYFLRKSVKFSLLTMFLYIVTPYTLFFDRMALADSLLAALAVWSLLFAFLLGKERRLDLAMILGMILGASWLTKSPGMFLILLTPLVVLGSYYQEKKSLKVKPLLKLGLLVGVSLFFSLMGYNLLRLGPNFHMIALRNKDYVWPIKEVLKHPLDPLRPHLRDVWRYYTGYLTLPLFVLGFWGIVKGLASKKLRLWALVLLVWWLFPLLVQSALARVFTARYLLYGVPAFLVFMVLGWESLEAWLKSRKIPTFFVFLLLVPALFFNYQLWSNITKAPLPRDEYAGYLQEWTAGWGIKEVAEYLRVLPREDGIVVGTEGYFGTLPDGLQIYLEGEADISVIGVGYPIKILPESLVNAKEYGNQVYLVVNQSRMEYPRVEELELVSEYEKAGEDKFLFFKL